MKKDLSHLSSREVENVISRYYAGERIQNILDEYDIDVRPSGLVSLFPPLVHQDLTCLYCESVRLQTKRKSRSAGSWNTPVPTCPSCGHKHTESCRCSHCKKSHQEIVESINDRKREIVYSYHDNARICEGVENISFRDAVYLLSIMKHSASEDLSYVDPFNTKAPMLAPTYNLRNFIVQHLYAKAFIRIDPESNIDAFVFDEMISDIEAYYPTKVSWELLPNMDAHDKNAYLRTLRKMVDGDEWPDTWRGQIADIWRQVTKDECLEYYFYLISQRNFDLPEVGEKTHATFDNLLDHLSPAQAFNITWQSVRDTTDYIVRENLPKYRAKNMFIGAVQRKADKYRAEGWEAKNSKRDFNCPQTVLSSTFFDTFMRVGEKGFTERPSYYLEEFE